MGLNYKLSSKIALTTTQPTLGMTLSWAPTTSRSQLENVAKAANRGKVVSSGHMKRGTASAISRTRKEV